MKPIKFLETRKDGLSMIHLGLQDLKVEVFQVEVFQVEGSQAEEGSRTWKIL